MNSLKGQQRKYSINAKDIKFKYPSNDNVVTAIVKYCKLFSCDTPEENHNKLYKVINSNQDKLILSYCVFGLLLNFYPMDVLLKGKYVDSLKQDTNFFHEISYDDYAQQLIDNNNDKKNHLVRHHNPEIMEQQSQEIREMPLKHNYGKIYYIKMKDMLLALKSRYDFYSLVDKIRNYTKFIYNGEECIAFVLSIDDQRKFANRSIKFIHNRFSALYFVDLPYDLVQYMIGTNNIMNSLQHYENYNKELSALFFNRLMPGAYYYKTQDDADGAFASSTEQQFYDDVRLNLMTKSILAKSIRLEQIENDKLNQLYAKSFMTQKTSTKKAIEIVNQSTFKNIFKIVELDDYGTIENKLNYNKFSIINKAFPNLYSILPKVQNPAPDLRFRRLGHYNTTGLYFPNFNCICIDIRDTSSFVREYGKYLDYKVYNQVSLTPEFLQFVSKYINMLKKTKKLNSNKLNYYGLPTECFARCFEVYVTHEYPNNTQYFTNPNMYFRNVEYRPILQNFGEVQQLLSEIVK